MFDCLLGPYSWALLWPITEANAKTNARETDRMLLIGLLYSDSNWPDFPRPELSDAQQQKSSRSNITGPRR